MEHQKIRNGKTMTKTREELNEYKTYKSAMMCWESLDDSEPTSKKRMMLSQDEGTNDQADELDNKTHTNHTANMGISSLIPVND